MTAGRRPVEAGSVHRAKPRAPSGHSCCWQTRCGDDRTPHTSYSSPAPGCRSRDVRATSSTVPSLMLGTSWGTTPSRGRASARHSCGRSLDTALTARIELSDVSDSHMPVARETTGLVPMHRAGPTARDQPIWLGHPLLLSMPSSHAAASAVMQAPGTPAQTTALIVQQSGAPRAR